MKKTIASVIVIATALTFTPVAFSANAAEDDGDMVTFATMSTTPSRGPGAITVIDSGYAERVNYTRNQLRLGACWDISVTYQIQPTTRCQLF